MQRIILVKYVLNDIEYNVQYVSVNEILEDAIQSVRDVILEKMSDANIVEIGQLI